jgi:hypothetical protein
VVDLTIDDRLASDCYDHIVSKLDNGNPYGHLTRQYCTCNITKDVGICLYERTPSHHPQPHIRRTSASMIGHGTPCRTFRRITISSFLLQSYLSPASATILYTYMNHSLICGTCTRVASARPRNHHRASLLPRPSTPIPSKLYRPRNYGLDVGWRSSHLPHAIPLLVV